ncbi:hypothetical protein EXIGLDRAFT_794270 [Exidia glandulosa HHB12029]|uniref:F-box domain-containing protein n=1 Tax=Exidia glandulosa HHB12029 TaxID=1314781 RepID=A0A165GG31_EXIGL|nr:hypothetical protein EXIGLDRAFT_794270 [Exidia glandulosa HHB12029]
MRSQDSDALQEPCKGRKVRKARKALPEFPALPDVSESWRHALAAFPAPIRRLFLIRLTLLRESRTPIGERSAMDLFTSQKDEIYARTFGILGDLVDSRASVREDFVDLAATLSRAFQRAMADSAEGWNRSRSSIIRRIPPEILSDCALWMDFDDRVTASHICRHFRAVILDAPTLWDCVRIDSRHSHDVGLHKVKSLLQRSAALPLKLSFTRGASSSEIEACRPQFHRLRILEFSEVPAPAVLECRMPTLQVFKISASAQQETPVEVPAPWTGDGAPELRVLSLPAFSLPDVAQPFRNVTHFIASMKLRPDAAHLYIYFPRLISLTLTDLAHDSLVPQGSPPPSLEELLLTAVNDTAIDYMGHIEPYGTHPLRRLFLGSSRTLAPPLRSFAETHERPWRMFVAVDVAEMKTYDNGADDGVEYIVVLGSIPTMPNWLLAWNQTSPYFTRLVDLNISLVAFTSLIWKRSSMPHLRNLVIGIHDPNDEDAAEDFDWEAAPGSISLSAPELRAISVAVSFDAEHGARPDIDVICLRWFTTALPPMLRTCITFDGWLERISYSGSGSGAENPSALSMQNLRGFAQDIFINDVQV